MWILPIVGYAGVIVGFSFLTLAIASGLYYLSELVEEHTVLSKRLLRGLIYTIIVVQLLLSIIDKFPWKLSALSIFSHVVYMQNLRHFPTVKLTDPMFLLSCCLVILNHYLWFNHFQKPPHLTDPYHPSRYTSSSFYGSNTNPYDDSYYPTFTEISSYFGICVWLVPFSLFVALSAGENVLPSMGSEYATGEGSSFVNAGTEPGSAKSGGLGSVGSSKRGTGRESMFKATVNGIRDYVSESGQAMGLWKGEKSRQF